MNFQNNWIKSYTSKNIWHIEFGKTATEHDFLSFIEFYQNSYQHIKKTSIVFNALNLERISINQCYQLATMMQNMRPIHLQKLECFTILVNNPIILNILKFVFVIVPPVRPYGIYNNITNAYKFINDYNVL
tara:strand:- start:5926 stop:6318 length:393 start_codon:yes stop_codon:yes gene_type:complete